MNKIFIVQFSIKKLVVPFKIVSTRINTLNHSSLPRLEAAGKVLFCKASQLSCHAVFDLIYRCKMQPLHH